MSETPPPERPEFVLPAPKRMNPWVKALVVISLVFLLQFAGCVALIELLEEVSVYETVD